MLKNMSSAVLHLQIWMVKKYHGNMEHGVDVWRRATMGQKKFCRWKGVFEDMEKLFLRVDEVKALMALLEEHHMHKSAALRMAVECVYGLKESFYKNQYAHRDMIQEDEKDWEKVDRNL